MSKSKDLYKNFERISKKLEEVSNELEKLVPKIVVREATLFGNSSHVVLSKNFVDRKVGVILLDDIQSDFNKFSPRGERR